MVKMGFCAKNEGLQIPAGRRFSGLVCILQMPGGMDKSFFVQYMRGNSKYGQNDFHNVSFNPDFHRQVRQAGFETAMKNLIFNILRKCCLQNWLGIKQLVAFTLQ